MPSPTPAKSDTASPTLRRLLCPAMLAGIVAWLPPLAFADCNPPCRNGKVCRYDSTHNPPFFCRKPPSAQAAVSSPAPAASPANPVQRQVARQGPRKAVAQYNPKELGIDRRK